MTWLDGWERIEIANRAGGSYTGDEPWRCVLHSTEGLSVASAVGAYTTAGVPPTVTIGIAERRKVQHIDTDRSAYAVMNQPGGVETNRWRAIQAEIVMFADQTKATQYGGLYVGDLTDDDYAFLRECLLELQADKPFSFDGPDFIRYPESYGNTQYRMSFAEWEQFGGTCGHQHVPENDHGDPGDLSRARLFGQILNPTTAHPAPPAPSEDDDMNGRALILFRGQWWVFRRGDNGHVYYSTDGVEIGKIPADPADPDGHGGTIGSAPFAVIDPANGDLIVGGKGSDDDLTWVSHLAKAGGSWSAWGHI